GRGTEAEVLEVQKVKQTPRLAGKEPEGGAGYDPKEPAPPAVVIRPPLPPGEAAASPAEIKTILDEIYIRSMKKEPPARPALETMIPFSAKVMEKYKADYADIREVLKIKRQELPLRAAVVDAVDKMRKYASRRPGEEDNGSMSLRERFVGGGDKAKAEILQE